MSHPRADEFAAMVGTRFRVAEAPVEVVLIEAATPRAGVLSLLFHSTSHTQLPQGTYHLATADTSEPIFLVPISADEHGAEYEAVFA